jgi:hypothetical protein
MAKETRCRTIFHIKASGFSNLNFSYIARMLTKTAGDRELTPVVSAGGQNWSYGINAMQLAFALRVEVNKLFECNRG